MDSCLDRYISNEYLVSPCPRPSNATAGADVVMDARAALASAKDALQRLRNVAALDDGSKLLLSQVEQELARASALLDRATDPTWLS